MPINRHPMASWCCITLVSDGRHHGKRITVVLNLLLVTLGWCHPLRRRIQKGAKWRLFHLTSQIFMLQLLLYRSDSRCRLNYCTKLYSYELSYNFIFHDHHFVIRFVLDCTSLGRSCWQEACKGTLFMSVIGYPWRQLCEQWQWDTMACLSIDEPKCYFLTTDAGALVC